MKVTLRPIMKEDLEWARKLRNKNRKCFYTSTLITKEDMQKWFSDLKMAFYIIWDKERIGTISINGQELGHICIDEQFRHKGYLKKSIKILRKRHNNLFLSVGISNQQAIKIYEKCGFKAERILMYDTYN